MPPPRIRGRRAPAACGAGGGQAAARGRDGAELGRGASAACRR